MDYIDCLWCNICTMSGTVKLCLAVAGQGNVTNW